MIQDIRDAYKLLESLDEVMMMLVCFLVLHQHNVRRGASEEQSKPLMEAVIDIRFDATRGKEILQQIAKIEEKQNHLDQISIIEDLYQKLSDVEEKTNKMHNRRFTYISK